jgi:hypothetical protein
LIQKISKEYAKPIAPLKPEQRTKTGRYAADAVRFSFIYGGVPGTDPINQIKPSMAPCNPES